MRLFLLLSFSLLFVWQSSMAQNYLPASVYDKEGNVHEGEIDFRDWEMSPQEILFRQGEATTPYTPADAAAFKVAGRTYKTLTTDLNLTPKRFERLSNSPEISIQPDSTFFAETIVEGNISLFYLKDADREEHFFIATPAAQIIELFHHRYYTPDHSRIVSKPIYIGQLRAIANTVCSSPARLPDTLPFTHTGLQQAVETLNACTGTRASQVSSGPKNIISLFVSAGANYSRFKVRNVFHSIDEQTQHPLNAHALSPILSLGFEHSTSWDLQRLSAGVEFSYLKSTFQGTATGILPLAYDPRYELDLHWKEEHSTEILRGGFYLKMIQQEKKYPWGVKLGLHADKVFRIESKLHYLTKRVAPGHESIYREREEEVLTPGFWSAGTSLGITRDIGPLTVELSGFSNLPFLREGMNAQNTVRFSGINVKTAYFLRNKNYRKHLARQ